MNPTENFRADMRAAGLDYAGPIELDGRLHRFKAEGDHDANSWYVLYPGPPIAGAFGCWKRDIKAKWCEKSNNQLSKAEREILHRRLDEAARQREATEVKDQAAARREAQAIISSSSPVTTHGYLESKGVRACGELRERSGSLVVPLRDIDGKLHSLQFIDASGEKDFLWKGRVKGCFFTVSEKPNGPLVVCEGIATGISIHEATALAVVVAMNCHNLVGVAQALRAKWQDREIILAGDNDAWTPGNPGITKATEAAKAIRAKLAVPQFRDATSKPTDFNDLARLEGKDTVKKQIESAVLPKESDEETFARLAALNPADYDRAREQEAERLGIRVGTLDAEVAACRPKPVTEAQGTAVDFPVIEPWEAEVSGSALLDEIDQTLRRFIVATEPAFVACTLYAVFTFVFDWFDVCPLLFITSPTKRCGKSRASGLLKRLVCRPLACSSASAAGIYRTIELHQPCLVIDEVDTFLKGDEQLRGLINSGHTRDAAFHLGCVPKGDNFIPVRYSTWGPKILSGIGRIADTMEDRAVIVAMKRKRKQDQVERLRYRHAFEPLRRKTLRWIKDHEQALRDADPPVPEQLHDRAADNWTGLLAIADLAGGEWPAKARQAALGLCGVDGQHATGEVQLLADIAAVFAETGSDRISSESLCSELIKIEGHGWAELGKNNRPITPNKLASMLKPFGVQPDGVRIGDKTPKGYMLCWFDEAFTLYLPETDSQGATPQQGLSLLNETHFSQGATSESVAPCKNATSANNDEGCCGVAPQEPEPGAGTTESTQEVLI